MYRRIAIPLDGSETALRALPVGQRLARLHQAQLLLVVVAPLDMSGSTAQRASDRAADPAADPARIFAAATEILGPDTVYDTLVIPHDIPAEALAEFDAGDPRTLLCMSTRGHGILRRAVIGSTARQVVKNSPHAIVLVGPHCNLDITAAIDTIIICLDGTPEAESVVPWASEWSSATSSRLLLLHVVYPIGDPAARLDPPSPRFRTELQYLAQVADRLETEGRSLHHVTLAHEDPSAAIEEATRHHHEALIAVATSHPTPLKEFLFGSTAHDVINSSTVPVLVASRTGTIPPPRHLHNDGI
jgi:nucleotide-binding universal stress UspA family protein